jgi:hypothetical protein
VLAFQLLQEEQQQVPLALVRIAEEQIAHKQGLHSYYYG